MATRRMVGDVVFRTDSQSGRHDLSHMESEESEAVSAAISRAGSTSRHRKLQVTYCAHMKRVELSLKFNVRSRSWPKFWRPENKVKLPTATFVRSRLNEAVAVTGARALARFEVVLQGVSEAAWTPALRGFSYRIT